MTETRMLLREYVEKGSESAFRELVERYIDLVYSTALRLVAGDSHRAEDIAQMVFVRLTRKAKTLGEEASLGGWLHRDTCYVATTLMRGERRRQNRERQAVEMSTLRDEPDTNLANVLPILDEAINELGDEEREAIMLRFFEQQSFRALGEIVGSSEDAARMRVHRALEKLHGLLRARGVAAVSVGALATVLGAKAISAAPVGLAASVVKGIGTSAIGDGTTSQAVLRPLAKTLKRAFVPTAALMLMLSVGIYAEHRTGEKAARNSVPAAANAAPAPAPVPAASIAAEPAAAETTNAPSGVMMFHVVDAVSGAPLSAAKVRVAYFPSKEGKVVHVQTDGKGEARIGLPQPPETSANIWVTAAGNAPMVTSLVEGQNFPTSYVMKMPAGTTMGGVVVDEEQQPVANVKVEFPGLGLDMTKRDNEEFGPDTTRYTDEIGRWWSDTVPLDSDKIRVLLTQADYAATVTNVSVNAPDAASIVLLIRKGVMVAGTVTDQNGQPIAGASVRQIENRMEPPLSAKSDNAGRFELGRLTPGELTLAVEAEGLSPVVVDTTVSNSPVELGFKLAPGHVLRGRVLDESGAPIAGAMIKTEPDMFGERKFVWSGTTDQEGRFEWKSAPGEAVSYSIEAEGFANASQSLQAVGTEQDVALVHARAAGSDFVRLRGTVLDADTGQPVDDFKVLIGRVIPVGTSIPREFRYGTDGKNGLFDFRINGKYMMWPVYQVEVEKDGYAPTVSTNLLVGDGDRTLTFNLHKDAGLTGGVLLPNGNPATNATVFLCDARGYAYINEPGKVGKEFSTRLHTRPDKHGQFSFAAVLDPRGFIVVDDEGFAEVPIGSFSSQIVLQPWGRIEGKLVTGGRPAAGQTICITQPLYRRGSGSRMLVLSMETTTDDDGRFVFEKVPPGERLITQWTHKTEEKVITVAPGVVTPVELEAVPEL